MRISDWSSDVCSSDLDRRVARHLRHQRRRRLQVAGLRLHIGLLDQRGRAIGAIVLRDDPVQRFGRGLRLAGVRLVERGDQRLRLLAAIALIRSEEHTSELQSLMRISYAVFCLKKKKKIINQNVTTY